MVTLIVMYKICIMKAMFHKRIQMGRKVVFLVNDVLSFVSGDLDE